MDQLEALSEMIRDEEASGDANILALRGEESPSSFKRSQPGPAKQEDRLTAYEEVEEDRRQMSTLDHTVAVETSFLSMTSQSIGRRQQKCGGAAYHFRHNSGEGDVHQHHHQPWPQLVEELHRRIRFLERDRSELARITQVMITLERESHDAKLEAAVATARRQCGEQFELYKRHVTDQMKNLYTGLCLTCQRRIYTAV